MNHHIVAAMLVVFIFTLCLCGCSEENNALPLASQPIENASYIEVTQGGAKGASAEKTPYNEPKVSTLPFLYDESLGSANTPAGKTLIVSVFADDTNYSWDFNDEADLATRERIKDYLGIATDYLKQAVAQYGAVANFIYDFDANNELCYTTSFDCDTTSGDAADAEASMVTFLETNVDSTALRQKYQANNMIYLMLINSDESCSGVSCTRNYYEGIAYPYEIIFLYNVDSGIENCPAVYAHEMMHCFGAPDLYYLDEVYGFSQKFLDYVASEMSNDLMFTCNDLETGDYVYDRITNEFSELDAYYAGLTDHSVVAERFGLGKSQH